MKEVAVHPQKKQKKNNRSLVQETLVGAESTLTALLKGGRVDWSVRVLYRRLNDLRMQSGEPDAQDGEIMRLIQSGPYRCSLEYGQFAYAALVQAASHIPEEKITQALS